jgi:5-methyltetrahydropteroyltriglutamate--homocysteine methyltransferase
VDVGLLTTGVGALPKPADLRLARWRFAEGEIDEAGLYAVEDEAVKRAIELQASLGIDLPVDAQMDRGDMVSFLADRLPGLEEGGLVRCFGNRYYRRPRVTDGIRRGEPLTVESWKRAQALSDRPLRAVLPGPYTLMDWSFDEHYGSRETCCMAFAEAMRGEAEDLLAAGAREIQIDEPAISTRPEELELATEALGRVTTSLRGKARTWTHVCYGDYRDTLERILDLPVDVVMLDLSHVDDAMLERLTALPEGRTLGVGVVDAVAPAVETAAEVGARIERVLRHLSADRLVVAPDAGLRALTEEQARGKLEALVAAARSATAGGQGQ